MRRTFGIAAAGTLLALSLACGGSEPAAGPGDAATPAADGAGPDAGAVARFELPERGVLDWGAVPFPSDLYLDEAGAVGLGALPTGLTGEPVLRAVRETVAARRGFCATCNVYFVIDGELDDGSVPSSRTRDDTATPDDAVVLVDVDPGSPERGRLFPVRLQWSAANHWLAVRPARGLALHATRRYAVALTAALRSRGGQALAASATFRAARDEGSGGGPAVERARAHLAPALEELERAGIARRDIVSVAAFTTEDVTADLRATRALLAAAPRPVASVDRVWTGAELDALLGTPSAPRPGIDVPPADGTEGTRAVRHDTVSVLVTGRFAAPRFVTGSGTDIGSPLRDPTGALVAGELQDVPFLLIVPRDADLAHLPVVVSHHGLNASRTTGFVLADTAGHAGAAVLAIDAFQHGARAPSATDTVDAMRGGLAGPDGFAETSTADLTARVFGLGGAAPGLEVYPGYPLGAFLQFAADALAAVRFAREGELAAIRAADPSLAALAFDPDHVFYVGNSLGSVVGTSVLVAEPEIAGAVLNVPPGSIVENLCESPGFRGLTLSVFAPLLGLRGSFDEVGRALVLEPVVDLFRWVLEPIDPLALAPYLVRDPPHPGRHPDVLWQLAGLDEVASVPATESMLAAAGAEEPSTDRALEVTRYRPGGHGMLELSAEASRYEPPYVPPLRPRDPPLDYANPIVEVHAEIEAFLGARIGGAAGAAR